MGEDGRGAGWRWKREGWRLEIYKTDVSSLCSSVLVMRVTTCSCLPSLSLFLWLLDLFSFRFPLPSHSKNFMIYRSSQFHESGWLGKHGWWFIQSKSSWMWTSGCLISNGLGRPSTLALVAFFILHIIISQVEAVIATHILSSSQHLIGLILVKTWENGWQSHALDWLPQFVPDFLNFF